ncbi:hypothetical protein R80B4_01259 [Fibrobacteres bacterium R8-0-B4]
MANTLGGCVELITKGAIEGMPAVSTVAECGRAGERGRVLTGILRPRRLSPLQAAVPRRLFCGGAAARLPRFGRLRKKSRHAQGLKSLSYSNCFIFSVILLPKT